MLISALLAIGSTGLPAVTVKSSTDGYIATVPQFALDQTAAVDSDIADRATELCAGKDVKWGKFGSLTTLGKKPGATPPKVSGYYKEFSCVAAQPRNYAAAPADWQPSSSDDADVRHFFDSYYTKRDGGDFAAALAMFQPGEGFAKSLDEQRAFNSKLGTGQRRITHVTWYVNPDAAAHPGIFAALDFVGEYKSMHFYCGYLGLYRVGPGSYEIVREEQNMFERNDHAPDLSQLANMRTAACRDN